MKQQTTCSGCGANFTNTQNCDFCGTAVPRVEQPKPKIENVQQPQPEKIIQREMVIEYVNNETPKSDEKLGCLLWGICFLIPLVGLILFFVYRSKNETIKAQTAIIAAIVGFIVDLILIFTGFWDALFWYW